MIDKLRREISTWLLKPPYDGVIWVVWIYIVAACLYAGGGPFAGDLVGFDDRVRLVQIFDWLNGQAWHDRTIMRVNQPEGFHTIWSRVVDLPAAGLIASFQNFVGQMYAGMMASIIIPLLQTLALFFVAARFAKPLAGERCAKLVALFILFTSAMNAEAFTLSGFQVGMIGHHAWYVLFALLLFGSLTHLITTRDKKAIVIGGLSIGGLLIVGIEGLPLIAGTCALIAFIGWFYNRAELIRDALGVTAIGAVIGFLSLPANQPFEKILTVSFAEPSILGPILVLAGAVFFAGQYLVLRQFGAKKQHAVIGIAVIGATITAALLYHFPQFLDGAAAALSPEERKLAADEHLEAKGLFELARNNMDYLRMIVPPFVAACFAWHKLSNTKNQTEQALAIFYLGLVVLTFALASLFSRYYHYVGLTTCPLLLWLWLDATQNFARNDYRALKSFGLFVLLCPLWMWIIPGANYNQAFGSSVLLFPAKLQTEPQHCDTTSFTKFLSLKYGNDKTIIVPMYKSDRFLLHTPLNIYFLANFPSGNKFIDAKAFYETGKVDEAHDIATRGHIDLVAVCTKSYLVSTQSTRTNELLRGHMSFGQLLVTGQAPTWLKQVDVAASTPWLLFEVIKP